MLSDEKIAFIKDISREYWDEEVKKPYFVDLAKGKEIGHRIADLVDEKTSALITLRNLTKQQHGKSGTARARSMGDVWLEENGIYHPINVKAGVAGREGQPNMVSIGKLLAALMERQIDSYYLLMVKLEIGSAINPTVYFLDMLDYLEYVTFDSGPGQIMLRATSFFNNYDPDAPVLRKSPKEKVAALIDLFEDGERRLKINRERRLVLIRKQAELYLSTDETGVTPETQRGLNLQ